MRRLIARVCLLAIAWASLTAGTACSEESVPAPQGYVNDRAGVISAGYREKLTALIAELERKTGAEIAVLTIESIAPLEEKAFSRLVFDQWKIGKKGKDNGLLVLLVTKDRLWRIETGYGLEGILPDGACGEIARDAMLPYFKAGDYGKGLYHGVAALAARIAADAGATLDAAPPPSPKANKEDLGAAFAIFLALFFFVWNLPWPFIIGLPFSLVFAIGLYQVDHAFGYTVAGAYAASLLYRYWWWRRQPPGKRGSFFGHQTYGGRFTNSNGTGYRSGGFGGGGLSGGGFGGGGFGGGFGGGGGAGGRF